MMIQEFYHIERVRQGISLLTDSLLTSPDEIINRFPSYLIKVYSIFLRTLRVGEKSAIENLLSPFKHALHTRRNAYFICICAYIRTYVHTCIHMYGA